MRRTVKITAAFAILVVVAVALSGGPVAEANRHRPHRPGRIGAEDLPTGKMGLTPPVYGSIDADGPLKLLNGTDVPEPSWSSLIQFSQNDWRIECVDGPKRFSEMTNRSLRLGGDGRPHIAYG